MRTSTPQPQDEWGHWLPDRISIVGTSGSGKSTLAHTLGRLLQRPTIELDSLNWGPNWTERPVAELRDGVDRATSAPLWVTDGNYGGKVRDLVWGRAQGVIWLDYPYLTTLGRVTRRTAKRVLTQEELWSGNRESWRTSFASKDSVIWWAATTWTRRRREIPLLLARPEFAHLKLLRFTSPEQTDRWVASLRPAKRTTP
jgi:adenylate kinase family enzyme